MILVVEGFFSIEGARGRYWVGKPGGGDDGDGGGDGGGSYRRDGRKGGMRCEKGCSILHGMAWLYMVGI